MSLKNSSIVLGVIFCESENKSTPSAGRVYHYFVPQAIIDDGYQPKQGGYVTISGGDGRTALGRIETIADTSQPHIGRTKATKAILGIVDMGHTEREQQRVKRTREIMEALTEMDERRKQRLRFDELAKDNVAAGALLTELDALQNG